MTTITAPTSRTTGTVITASIWNTDHNLHYANAEALNTGKQEAHANLTTVAGLNPAAAGFLAMQGLTVEDVLNALLVDWTDGHSGAVTSSISDFIRNYVVDVASYCDADPEVDAHADVQAALDDGLDKIIVFRPRAYKSLTRPAGAGRSTGVWTLPKRTIVIFMAGAYLDATAWSPSGSPKYLLYGAGTVSSAFPLNATAAQDATSITLTDATNFPSSGYGIIMSDETWTTQESYGLNTHGEWVDVADKAGNVLTISGGLRDTYTVGNLATGTAQAGGADTITLEAGAGTYAPGVTITLTGGTGSGQTRTVESYDGTTKVLTVTENWTTQPDATTTYAFPAGAEMVYLSDPLRVKIYGLDLRGPGQFNTDTEGDLGVYLEHGIDCEVYGRITRSDQRAILYTVMKEFKMDVTVTFDPTGTNTVNQYGPHVGALCEDGDIVARVYGGKEGSGSTITGSYIGPSRNVTWRNGYYTNQWRGAHTHHDMMDGWRFVDNVVDAVSLGVDARSNNGLVARNKFTRLGFYGTVPDAAVLLGSGVRNLMIANNDVDDAGYLVQRGSTTEDETVTGVAGNIFIVDNYAKNLQRGGVSILMDADDDTATRATLVISGGILEMVNTVNFGIIVEGPWTKPVVKDIVLLGGADAAACVYLHNTSAGAGNGPVSPTITGVIYDAFTAPVVQHETGQKLEFNNYKIGQLPNGLVYTVGSGAATAAHTGDVLETALASVSIPAKLMGPNGWIEVDFTYGTPGGSGNTKTARVRYSGAAGTLYYGVNVTTALSLRGHIIIQNRNSVSSQRGAQGSAVAASYGSSTSAIPTSAVDTDGAARTISFNGLLGNSTDSILLEGYTVKVFYHA